MDSTNPTVHVRFVDAASGETFAESMVPLENLPETFEVATTLHLGDQDWQVLEANPPHAAEFGQSGALRLVLQRLHTVDPKDLLYSLPTINDALPAMTQQRPAEGKVLELHEDDWRQVELVSIAFADAARECLAQILEVHRESEDSPGFRRLHVRTEVPSPLAGVGLKLADLRSLLAPSTPLAGVSLGTASGPGPGLIGDGFAIELPSGFTLYGTAAGDLVQTLGLERWSGVSADEVSTLNELASSQELVLIDWCRVALVEPGNFVDHLIVQG